MSERPNRSVLWIQTLLERWLPDPYDEMVEMLRDGVPFAFSRFGDGEFNAIFGVEGVNRDGHQYFPEMGRRLREIVAREPDYLMGLQPMAIFTHGARQTVWMSERTPNDGFKRWVLADSLHDASLDDRLDSFLDSLAGRDVLLVGPEHLRGFTESKGWGFQPVPAQDCWTAYEETLERLKSTIPGPGGVVLLCASMMSNVLLDDLFELDPTITYIDTGSLFDPYAGVISRPYHEELELELES